MKDYKEFKELQLLTNCRKGNGACMGVQIDMLYGKNIGIEINMSDVEKNYEDMCKSFAQKYPEFEEIYNDYLESKELINYMFVTKVVLILDRLQSTICNELEERNPTNYDEELEIVKSIFSATVQGRTLEEVVARTLISENIEGVFDTD